MEKLDESDYYKLLGVPRGATEQEISKAYKKLAIKFHPDKNPDNKEQAEENFKKVCEAYEVLSNKEKRQTYDQFGKSGLNSSGMSGGVSSEQAEAIFSQFFGGKDPFSVLFGKDGVHGMGGGIGGMPGGVSFQFQSGGPGMGQMPGGIFHEFSGGMHGLPPEMAAMFSGMDGIGGGRRGKRTRRERPDLLPIGTRVRVRGLQGAKHHNGKPGNVKAYDETSQRYSVQLDDGEVLKIKMNNLLQILQAKVVNMTRAELNGMDGVIEAFDEEKQRYHVSLNGTDKVALSPSNVVLPKGARAQIVNLTKGTQWNHKVGQVIDYDNEGGRYLVQMSEEQQLRVKLENLLL
ncbi:hypothetical protein AB1Y20_006541 [Prymnesium parvum]